MHFLSLGFWRPLHFYEQPTDKKLRKSNPLIIMVRAVVRICPNVSFHPSILPSSTPRYFYEATDLENFKLYESNVRHCGLESRVDMIYDQNCSQYDFFEKEVSKYVQMAVRGTDSSVLLLGCPHGGRRYSLEGTSEYPGLYFRSLDMILSSISMY